MRKSRTPYVDSVFINCPFDDEYRPLFRAIVFTVAASGFIPRCTLEHEDASQVRVEKIYRLIEQSAFGIHDVPSGKHLSTDYDRFTDELPELCEALRLDPSDLTFTDFYGLVFSWLAANR